MHAGREQVDKPADGAAPRTVSALSADCRWAVSGPPTLGSTTGVALPQTPPIVSCHLNTNASQTQRSRQNLS